MNGNNVVCAVPPSPPPLLSDGFDLPGMTPSRLCSVKNVRLCKEVLDNPSTSGDASVELGAAATKMCAVTAPS
jgi:hypothetical protein